MFIGVYIFFYIYLLFMYVLKVFILLFFNEFSLMFNEDIMYLYILCIELVRGWGFIFSIKIIDKF